MNYAYNTSGGATVSFYSVEFSPSAQIMSWRRSAREWRRAARRTAYREKGNERNHMVLYCLLMEAQLQDLIAGWR